MSLGFRCGVYRVFYRVFWGFQNFEGLEGLGIGLPLIYQPSACSGLEEIVVWHRGGK